MTADLVRRLREFGAYGHSEESRLMAEAADAIERGAVASRMTPVVLIGTDRKTGDLKVVGLYDNKEAADQAVQTLELPDAHYSVMTPPLNGYLQRREVPPDGVDVLVPLAEFK